MGSENYIFLAAEIDQWADYIDLPPGASDEQISKKAQMGTNITIRGIQSAPPHEVIVVDFEQTPGALPRLGRIRMMPPTSADLKYMEALKSGNLPRVDIDGKAIHG